MKNIHSNINTIVSVTPVAVVADSRTYKIAASFRRFGYTSLVVEGEKSNIDPASLPFELRSIKGGVIFSKPVTTSERRESPKQGLLEWIRHGLMRLFKPFLNQFRAYRALPRATLYYLHSYYLFPAVYLRCLFHGSSYIYDAHDYYSLENTGKLSILIESLCIKNAELVVTVSAGVAQLMKDGFNCEPFIVRNCYDSRLDTGLQQDLRGILGLSKDDFLLVTVGQAKDGMAVAEALQALKDMPSNIHLAFVGKNTHDYAGILQRYQLKSRVHLVPPVPSNQVVPFISTADASIILYYPRTSNYEYCLPNGFFQSITARLPLIYSALPEIKRIAEQYDIGIPINPQSFEEIRSAVTRLMNVQGLKDSLKANLTRASIELSWEREENILRDLLRRALKEERS